MKNKQLLVLAPHTDDAEIGCGGAISFFKRNNFDINIAVFSKAEASLPPEWGKDTLLKEFFLSAEKMNITKPDRFVYNFPVRRFNEHRQDILEIMIEIRNLLNPSLVLLPSTTDFHQDHQVISNEGIRAFKSSSILGYELPWNHNSFHCDVFIHLNDNDVRNKWDYMSSYKSQIELSRGYFDKAKVMSWLKMRGMQCNTEYAECFEHIRTHYR